MCGLCEDGADVLVTVPAWNCGVTFRDEFILSETRYYVEGAERWLKGNDSLDTEVFVVQETKVTYWITREGAEKAGLEWREPA